MKLQKNKLYWCFTSIVYLLGYFVSGTKNNQMLISSANTKNGTDLLSLNTSTAPTIEGQVDPFWASLQKPEVVPQVPDQGYGFFSGNYNGILPQNNNMFNQNDFTKGQFLIGFNITRLWNF